jgi:deferrochelatase/peroxidase EfeB
MLNFQTGILQDIPEQARYLFFSLNADAESSALLKALQQVVDGEKIVVGFGCSLLEFLNIDVLNRANRKFNEAPVYSGSYFWCPPMDNGLIDLGRKFPRSVDS